MPYPTFPNADLQDSALFRITIEDPAIRNKEEEGVDQSRARHTRTPRRVFSSGFSFVPESVRSAFETHHDLVGGYSIFDWENPATKVTQQVRFTEEPEYRYVGSGGLHRWDITFKVREV